MGLIPFSRYEFHLFDQCADSQQYYLYPIYSLLRGGLLAQDVC